MHREVTYLKVPGTWFLGESVPPQMPDSRSLWEGVIGSSPGSRTPFDPFSRTSLPACIYQLIYNQTDSDKSVAPSVKSALFHSFISFLSFHPHLVNLLRRNKNPKNSRRSSPFNLGTDDVTGTMSKAIYDIDQAGNVLCTYADSEERQLKIV